MRAPNLFTVFYFRLHLESIKELGNVSLCVCVSSIVFYVNGPIHRGMSLKNVMGFKHTFTNVK
jgi:hypothetical protein